MSDKDKILEEVLKSAMPKARLIERAGVDRVIIATDAPIAEAAAPDLASLIRKYVVGTPKKRKAAPESDAASAGSESTDEAVETARVLINTSGKPASDVAKRLAKRTVVIDTQSKKLLGSSG